MLLACLIGIVHFSKPVQEKQDVLFFQPQVLPQGIRIGGICILLQIVLVGVLRNEVQQLFIMNERNRIFQNQVLNPYLTDELFVAFFARCPLQ